MRSSLVVIGVLVATPARADRIGGDELEIAFFHMRSAIAPAPPQSPQGGESLGLDLQLHSISVGWGKTFRHRIELSSAEAPDFGDRQQSFLHFGRYDLAWRGDGVTVRGGLRALTLWSDELRFGTPVVGVSIAPVPRARLDIELESAGLFVASLRDTPRSRRDLAIDVRGVWPTDTATRGELRVRARDYTMTPDDEMDVEHRVRDVTVTAGLGLAMVHRKGVRGMPGFLGVAVRATEGSGASLFVVAELGFAAMTD